jgi:hypothetical protein
VTGRFDVVGFVVAAVAIAALGGAAGCGIGVMGLVEAITGRLMINLRRLPWSRRDAEIIGLCRVVQGVLIAVQSVAVALIVATQAGPESRILLPVFLLLMVMMGAALSIPAWLQVRLSARTGIPLF